MSDMLRRSSLHSVFSVDEEIASDDTRFLRIIIDLMHTGKNLNGSYFEKSVVNECIDSIKNTPVLGFIRYDGGARQSDFNGHEYIIVRTENGVEERYIGSCYGVIPESCNPRWVMKMCDDGVEREFLQVDAILWEKFSDATNILRRDGEKSESMELEITSIEGYEDNDGIFHFTKFKFDGACILGDTCTPAMSGANVRLSDGVNFSMSDFTQSIRRELNDKLELFNANFTKLVEEETGRGGVRNMPDTDFAQTVMAQFEDISIAVSEREMIETYWGQAPRFYLADIQDDEAIVVDASDHWRYYGFKFELIGDKPEIDFSTPIRKKVRYETYEEGSDAPEGAFEFGKHIAEIEEAAFAKVEEAESKVAEAEKSKEEVETEFAQIKADFEEMKPKYEEFVAAEEQRKADEISAEKDAKFAEYEEALSDVAEFSELKEKKDEMSVDEIEKECAVMYFKASRSKMNFSKSNDNNGAAVVGLLGENDDDNGFVHTKYGNIRVSR